MTAVRQRMVEDLQLAGMAESTQREYVRSARQLAEHYMKSPAEIGEEEIRQYFLYLKNVKKWARPTCTTAICGIKFFWEQTLKRDWTTVGLVRPAREKKVPVILTCKEVIAIMQQVRLFRYRVCLETIYSCGLRLSEGINLQVADVDSARGLLHVHGKGALQQERGAGRIPQRPEGHRHPRKGPRAHLAPLATPRTCWKRESTCARSR
ncbi:tyrosine-type recombinase/integrase [Verrucomicrobiota bacterium]